MNWYEFVLVVIGTGTLAHFFFCIIDLINRPSRKRRRV